MIGTVLVLTLLALARSEVHEAGRCTTYGLCHKNMPCVNNIKALPKPTGTDFDSVCPHLSAEAKLCCDKEQIKYMISNLKKTKMLLKSCNTALVNFRALVCDQACNPDQSQFLRTTESGVKDGKTYMKKGEMFNFISEAYANKVYNGLKDTSNMICGNWPWSQCSRDDLFGFLGDNKYTSLKVNYRIGGDLPSDDFVRKDDAFMKNCEEQDAEGNKCSCKTCSKSC